MSFQIVPFFDDDDLVLPWTSSYRRPSHDMMPWLGHQHWNPRREMARLFRDVDNLKREAFNNGIVPRDDAFEVALDVNGFEPKDLQVNVHDNYLTLSGRHEEKSRDGHSYVSRSFQRKYHLPENVNQDMIKSSLTNDGKTLRIEAPLLAVAAPETKAIPIEVSREKPKGIEHKKG